MVFLFTHFVKCPKTCLFCEVSQNMYIFKLIKYTMIISSAIDPPFKEAMLDYQWCRVYLYPIDYQWCRVYLYPIDYKWCRVYLYPIDYQWCRVYLYPIDYLKIPAFSYLVIKCKPLLMEGHLKLRS